MIVPSTRWFIVAAALGLLALVTLAWPGGAMLLFFADVAWVAALIIDVLRIAAVDLTDFPVVRSAPPAFSAGRTLPVTYQWRNPSRVTLTLRVKEDVPALLRVQPGSERRIVLLPGTTLNEELQVVPVRRGKALGGMMHLRVLAPWGLVWRQGKRNLAWPITVYPSLKLAALRALPAQTQRRRDAGFRNIRRIGEGRLFESIREWVPGEELRSIDWKATARRGKLMGRQYEDERRQHVMIVIDAGRMLTAEIDGRARLESAIEAALDLAHTAVQHDDNVGLLVFADEVLQFVAPTRGRRALRQVLDALAAVEGRLVEPNYPAAFAFLATRNRKRALTVLFTDVVDRTASDAFVAQAGSLRPRHLPLAVTLRDPGLDRLATARATTIHDAFERAAAEELLEARATALSELRSHGVLVLDVQPDGAARAVVDQYERVKRRALV